MEKAKITKVKIAVIAMKNSLLKKFEAASASSLLYPKKDGKKNATMKTIDINPIDQELAKVNFVRLFYQSIRYSDICLSLALTLRISAGTAYCNSDVIL